LLLVVVSLLLAAPASIVAEFYWGSAKIDLAKTGEIKLYWRQLEGWPRHFTISPGNSIHSDFVNWLNTVAERGRRKIDYPGDILGLASNTFEAHIRSTNIYLIVYGGRSHEIVMDFEPADLAFLESMRQRVNAAAAQVGSASK